MPTLRALRHRYAVPGSHRTAPLGPAPTHPRRCLLRQQLRPIGAQLSATFPRDTDGPRPAPTRLPLSLSPPRHTSQVHARTLMSWVLCSDKPLTPAAGAQRRRGDDEDDKREHSRNRYGQHTQSKSNLHFMRDVEAVDTRTHALDTHAHPHAHTHAHIKPG